MIAMIVNHLWQSTLFALAAGLLALVFRKDGAHVRYWIWQIASFKFLVPFSLLVAAGSSLGVHAMPALTPGPVVDAIELIAQPYVPSAPPPLVSPPHLTTVNPIAVLMVVWLCGFMAVLAVYVVRKLRLLAVLRSATPMAIAAPIPVKSSTSQLEPGIIGFARPVLLLPEGITAHLTAEELQAVIDHELCHLRRGDNLTAALHMVVQALFWFHPLVWWLGTRLVEERERACDEAVVNAGNPPETYAEAVLKVCKFYLQSPLICAAGVSGANLKQRIEAIMTGRRAAGLNIAKKILLAVLAMGVIAGPLTVGWTTTPQAYAQTNATVEPLEARLVVGASDGIPLKSANSEETVFVSKFAILESQDFAGAEASGKSRVSVHLTDAGTAKLQKASTENVGGKVAIILDGKVVMEPKIASPMMTRAFVLEGGSEAAAKDLVAKINEVMTKQAHAQSDSTDAYAIAQRRLEQAKPRTAIEIDPKLLDKYAGYYLLFGANPFIVSRDGNQLSAQIFGQPPFPIYPESEQKFFFKVVPAQISFVLNAQGQVTGFVLYQNGNEMSAIRTTEAEANRISEQMTKRIKDGTPLPGSEAALRHQLESILLGNPDYDQMTATLATISRPQMPVIRSQLSALGTIQSMSFRGVGPGGADVYGVKFEKGVVVGRISLTPAGKIVGLTIQPGP